ncbi:MAG: extracellular solute-binding protein [Chloroflexales bacterium]|nr:extracellular solute-binding protein [Chloroflexales bacterium]
MKTPRSPRLSGSLSLLLILLLLAACGGGQPTTPDAANTPPPDQTSAEPTTATATDAPITDTDATLEATSAATSPDAFFANAAAAYQGVTIRGISESTPPSNYVKDLLAPAFTAATGINVEFETTSWDQQYDKAIKDMQAQTGIYDFVYIEQDIIYSYLQNEYLVNLTQLLADNPDLAALDFAFDDFTSFIDYFKDADGNIYGVPMEAFIKVYLYRKDLFEDPAFRDAFQQEYGRELQPATTFEEYAQIADFFTTWGQQQGQELYGTTVQAHSGHPSSFYEFFESIAPSFGVYNWGINTETFKATEANGGQMNNARTKEALTFWLSMLDYAPPEATTSTWDEVASSFAAGRAAQGWVYGENAAWIATDDTRSQVVGNVGVALPPTYEGVIQDAEADRGYIGYYDGGAFGIPTSSKNQQAALLWLQYIGQPAVQAEWAVAASRIVQTATFDDPQVQEQNQRVDNYYTLMSEQGDLFAGAPPFPFHAQIREVVAPFIYRAITGELTPEEALDLAADATDQELAQLGYGQ